MMNEHVTNLRYVENQLEDELTTVAIGNRIKTYTNLRRHLSNFVKFSNVFNVPKIFFDDLTEIDFDVENIFNELCFRRRRTLEALGWAPFGVYMSLSPFLTPETLV